MSFLAIADREKFLQRAADRLDEVSRLLDRVDLVVKCRMGTTLLTVLLVALVARETVAAWWLFLTVALFAVLAFLHERWMRQARALHRMADFHRRASSRIHADLEDTEDRRGVPTEAIRRRGVQLRRPSLDEDKLAANRRNRVRLLDRRGVGRHLDLFESGQVFDRLADFRTDSGGETLAWWLVNPAPPTLARARQASVRELTPRVDLREAVAATGSLRAWPSHRWPVSTAWTLHPFDSKGRFGRARREAETDRPAEGEDRSAEGEAQPAEGGTRPAGGSGESGAGTGDSAGKSGAGSGKEKKKSGRSDSLLAIPPYLPPKRERLLLALAFANLALLWTSLPLALLYSEAVWVCLLAVFSAVVYGMSLRSRVLAHEEMGWLMEPELSGLREIVSIFEREDFRSDCLARLGEDIAGAGAAISRLLSLHHRLRFRRNLLFAPFGAVVFFGSQHALAIDRWRRRHGEDLEKWLRVAGEFDALLALSQYAEERPAHAFAEFDDTPGLRAVNLGHPLIPEERLVRNTVVLGRGEPGIKVVTGSNMSGKSTLLRALGVNFLLARMGAPVNATSLRVGPGALGVSVAVHDSLQDGVSKFLAELFALRQVLDTGSAREPLFFLLDEILQGTNSDDRRAAVFALVRELARRRAVGVMTTHDLSLTELAEELPRQVRNHHFSERIVDGVMDFDYDLREGPLTQGNALELMRMLNLPAPRPDGADAGEFTSLPGLAGDREH